MDDLTLQSPGGRDVWISIDDDGDLIIETDRDGRTLALYIASAGLPALRDLINTALSDSASANPIGE